MPLLLLGKDPSNYVKMDPSQLAIRVTARGIESARNMYHISAPTGNLTGVAANAPVFQLQNIGADLLLIKRVKFCFVLTTAFGAAQYLDFGLMAARAITAYGSSGTAIPLVGSNCKLMSDSGPALNARAAIATTGTLTTGTRTLDTYYMGQAGAWMGAIGASIPLTTLFEATPGKHYLTLAQAEGIEIAPVTAMGATGVGILGVTVEFADATAY